MAVFATIQVRIGQPGEMSLQSPDGTRDWTHQHLREAVAALDEMDSGPGQGISPEQVSILDILEFIYTQQIGVDVELISEDVNDE